MGHYPFLFSSDLLAVLVSLETNVYQYSKNRTLLMLSLTMEGHISKNKIVYIRRFNRIIKLKLIE